MTGLVPHKSPSPAQQNTAAAIAAARHFLAREAVGGGVLLLAAAAALLLANSSLRGFYEGFVHLPLSFGLGGLHFSFDVHFLINEILMTLFFLAVGVEIRQEIHDGALSHMRQAALPLVAALGGVCLPALIYWGFNRLSPASHGWAVPTATDIAFAVGILALLGRAVPPQLRIILLSLAVIDDIIAVLIIAFFYSGGLNLNGAYIAAAAVALVLVLQFFGFRALLLYILAGAVLWFGLWKMGIHPSLAGVALGLLTPVLPLYEKEKMAARLQQAMQHIGVRHSAKQADAVRHHKKAAALAELKNLAAQAEPAAAKLRKSLHFWVAFAVMPLFAFANAGVRLGDISFAAPSAAAILAGIVGGLALGKPLGVLGLSFLAVKLKLCSLPPQIGWSGMALIGILAGIGFTMAIFVAMLAYPSRADIEIATLAVLCGSAISALLGLIYGFIYCRRLKPDAARQG